MKDSTTRFSDRVNKYVQYRPTYPQALLQFMSENLGINKELTLADVGSGTGILTDLLLEQAKYVYAVEPNKEMRLAAEAQLRAKTNFKSISGTAENTTLESESVEAIAVAQAFHWFDIPKTIAEFKRITKDNGLLMLIWNRRLANTPFLAIYEKALQRYGTDYNEINHQNMSDKEFSQCFKEGRYEVARFDNFQEFDFEGVLGFLNSTSYAPKTNTAAYEQLVALLQQAFEDHSEHGAIRMNYTSEIYWGKIK